MAHVFSPSNYVYCRSCCRTIYGGKIGDYCYYCYREREEAASKPPDDPAKQPQLDPKKKAEPRTAAR